MLQKIRQCGQKAMLASGFFMLAGAYPVGLPRFVPLTTESVSSQSDDENNAPLPFSIIQDSALASVSAPYQSELKKAKVIVTAYSSSSDETDNTPFVTASGNCVRDGIVANNQLRFGTKIKIPELFGDKIFIVEDRMQKRFSRRVDVWMSSKAKALRFGKVSAEIEILD
ncbi:3D domain-containing protein [Patescibacteria group bacterium]|nr:3D domain-containing protein [Patescibacteria group bacterium]